MVQLAHLGHVLVVENEGLILLDIETTLADAGVRTVSSATTLEAALAALDTCTFDAAVLDLHLSEGVYCYDAARRLRACDTPFVFSSGAGSVEPEFADVPMLTKPFSSAQLVEILLRISSENRPMAAQ